MGGRQAFLVSGKMVSSHLLAEPVGCSRAEVAAFENFEKELRGCSRRQLGLTVVGVHAIYTRHSRRLKPEFRPTHLCILLVSAVLHIRF